MNTPIYMATENRTFTLSGFRIFMHRMNSLSAFITSVNLKKFKRLIEQFVQIK